MVCSNPVIQYCTVFCRTAEEPFIWDDETVLDSMDAIASHTVGRIRVPAKHVTCVACGRRARSSITLDSAECWRCTACKDRRIAGPLGRTRWDILRAAHTSRSLQRA